MNPAGKSPAVTELHKHIINHLNSITEGVTELSKIQKEIDALTKQAIGMKKGVSKDVKGQSLKGAAAKQAPKIFNTNLAQLEDAKKKLVPLPNKCTNANNKFQ